MLITEKKATMRTPTHKSRYLVCVQYLRPLVCLRVVSLHSVEIHLSVIPAHSVEAVPKETNTYSVSADAHGGDSRPHICLRVVSANKQPLHSAYNI